MGGNDLVRFLNDFASINPHPTQEQLEWLGMAIGIDREFMKRFTIVSSRKVQICARRRLQALTKEERTLNNMYDPNSNSPDNLILLDGDDIDEDPGMQNELGVDGIIADGEDLDKRALSRDGG